MGELRLALLSGDWLPVNLPGKIKALYSNIQVVSLGGATEASIWSIFYPIDKVESNSQSIPYGKPLDNQRFYVLNQLMQPTPTWVAGELYIGGMGLAKGYWQDEHKTKNSFITHPITQERLYKTGDLGRYLPSGEIEFLGREDFQEKINGFRIELGEIEAALKQHSAITQAVVSSSNNQLVAYVVPLESLSNQQICKFLKEKLPDYMVPSTFVTLDVLPLTPNGKIDRKALPVPDTSLRKQEYVAPRTVIEKHIAVVLKEVLQLEKVSIYDNFFELGANSLTLLTISSKLQKKLLIELHIIDMFTYPSIKTLSNHIVKTDNFEPLLKEKGLSRKQIKYSIKKRRGLRQNG